MYMTCLIIKKDKLKYNLTRKEYFSFTEHVLEIN